mmetsp:Transcript_23821/g.36822  ORF Transcript_23821/g.36822 Transcript_23821/m.36822 type:complete len:588 (+) Transcript_23821:679-2442(+)
MDKLILEYVAHLKPTAIIMNAGLWPNTRIANNMEGILRAAHNVSEGRVIWRGTTKHRDSKVASPSPADEAAKEWTYRLPGVTYQPFKAGNLTDADYFDSLHFSNSAAYRKWNADLKQVIDQTKKSAILRDPQQKVFMMSGAVRTLNHTYRSILDAWIYPLCAPPQCIAHVVTHFSLTDNRPDASSNDPRGMVVAVDQHMDQDGAKAMFENAVSNSHWASRKSFIRYHNAPSYDIGSEAESKAMDLMEEEMSNHTIISRLRVIRYGDPRRYSMWFSRAWMWRFVKQLEKSVAVNFDFYAFTRPDLQWFIPSPTQQFFLQSQSSNSEVWLHDSYYNDVPDTFAYLPSNAVAEVYFSLEGLAEPGVACLGGPTFNSSVVESRLEKLQIQTDPKDWCEHYGDDPALGIDFGWSEKILSRKLRRKMNVRYLHAGTAILRPPAEIDCTPLLPKFLHGWVQHLPSYVPFLSCRMIDYKIKKRLEDPFGSSTIFRLRDRVDSNLCLTRTGNGTFIESTCSSSKAMVYPAELFSSVGLVGDKKTSLEGIVKLIAFGNGTGDPFEIGLEESSVNLQKWRRESVQIYSSDMVEAGKQQ